MANEEHLKILKQGVIAWNDWRKYHPETQPDFSDATFIGADFSVMFPESSDIEHTTIVYIVGADLSRADFSRANLTRAHIRHVDFSYANLSEVSFNESFLMSTDFTGARLNYADFTKSLVGWNTFGNIDLSLTKGLDTVDHRGPSVLGIDTLYKSAGKVPEAFLRGCGVPDDFITYLPSLIGSREAVQFYSCFISYSHNDEEFAKRVHSRLRPEHIRVWFAPEDVRGGEKLQEQIDRAIQIHDRLLLVLSESSMQSEWVMSEIRKARKVEIKEKRQKLFPIRLVNFDVLRDWECFDADSGKDVAVEVREYFIPDFSDWKDHDAFESAFDKLLRDLHAAEAS